MPRKRTKERPKRDTPLMIRLTEEERRVFAEAAAKRHLTVSAWLRQLALDAAEREGIT